HFLQYAIFKSDFKHIIGTKYSNRDAITLLRTALTGKPLEMIKGIGSDYTAAWDYLDSVYGDPRFVSDTITQDIVRFKPLKSEEDHRFCEECVVKTERHGMRAAAPINTYMQLQTLS
ncbi:hypothetical protein AWC38_SpisGene15810, partial [Paramuricea clavata]